MEIKTSSLSDLLWTLQFPHSLLNENFYSRSYGILPGFILWLGAGASYESGVPLASKLATMALRSRYDYQPLRSVKSGSKMSDAEIDEWAKSAGYFDPDNRINSKYAQIMENVFPTAGLREQFLRRELRKAKVSDGYKILGELLRRGVFDTVLTTNFDHLVRQGADPVLPQPIEEVNAIDQYNRLTPFSEEPRLTRLHGDFWHGNMRSTEDELRQTPEIIFEAIKRLLCSYGLIVIGYGGEDMSVVQGLFRNLWKDPNTLRKGLYWCDIKDKKDLSPMVKSFLNEGGRTDRAFYVKIEGFDSLMRQLAIQFGINISLERELEIDLKEEWEWLALLTDLTEVIIGDDKVQDHKQKHLERLVKLLGADRAVLVTSRDDSENWKVTVVSGETPTGFKQNAISESLNQLHTNSLEYNKMPASNLSPENVFYELLKSNGQIESFPIWRDDRLIGLVAFVSKTRPLIEQQRVRLIRAAVRLLVSPQ